MQDRWKRGDHVIVRDPLETRSTRAYAAITGDTTPNLPGWPYVVVQDSDEVVALYLPEGSRLWRWNIIEQRFREPRPTQGHSLRLLFPGEPFHVDLFFESGSGPAPWVSYFFLGGSPPGYAGMPTIIGTRELFTDKLPEGDIYPGRFYGWKADIIAPFRRTELGFDVTDEVLDIVVRPDRTYALKDADQMEQLVAMGIYTRAEADRLHANAREVIDLVERRQPPFNDTWTSWQPLADLGIPEAPPGWQYLPLPDSEWGAIHRRFGARRSARH